MLESFILRCRQLRRRQLRDTMDLPHDLHGTHVHALHDYQINTLDRLLALFEESDIHQLSELLIKFFEEQWAMIKG